MSSSRGKRAAFWGRGAGGGGVSHFSQERAERPKVEMLRKMALPTKLRADVRWTRDLFSLMNGVNDLSVMLKGRGG